MALNDEMCVIKRNNEKEEVSFLAFLVFTVCKRADVQQL